MNQPQLTSGTSLRLIEQLAALARRRVEDEQAIADAHALRVARAEGERETRRAEISRKFDARRAAAEQPQQMQAEVLRQYDAERASVEERLQAATRKMRKRYRARLKAARQKRDRIHTGEAARFASRESATSERVDSYGELTAARRIAMAELALAADRLLAERGLAAPEKYESVDLETFDQDHHELFTAAMLRGERSLAAMRSLSAVRMAGPMGLLFGFVGLGIIGAIVAAILWGVNAWLWVSGAALVSGVIGALIVNRAAVPRARKQNLAHWAKIHGALAAAQAAADTAFADAQGDAQQQLETLAEKRDRKLHKASAARSKEASTMKATLERKLAANAEKVAARLARMQRERDSAIASATEGLPRRLAQLDELRRAALTALDDDHARRVAESAGRCGEELEEVASDWSEALRRWETSLAQFDAWCQRQFPAWSIVDRDVEFASPDNADGVRFGDYLVSPAELLAATHNEVPDWASAQTYAVPALLSFHDRPALLLATASGQRLRGVDVAYGIVLRMIAALGVEQVHCTVIDPQAIGGRFERLVRLSSAAANIDLATTDWQIEQALAQTRQHVAQVSRGSGDLTAPQRVLVVLGSPATAGLAQLKEIIARGACGGVSTLISIEADRVEEVSTALGDASQHVLSLSASDGQFQLRHDTLGPLRVACNDPPPAAVAAQLLQRTAAATNGHAVSSGYAAARS